jgi:hypothetical protein
MNHLSTLQDLKQYGHRLFQKVSPKASLSLPDLEAVIQERRSQAVAKGKKALRAIADDLRRGDRSPLENRIVQLNSSFDMVELADELKRFLNATEHPFPTPLQTTPEYLIGSWFLADCLSYLTGDPQRYERLHLVTGIKINENQRTLDRMVKVPLKLASETGALADQHELQKALIEMDGRGHPLHGLFHSHPGQRALATRPSTTDKTTHERYERGGYPLIGAIFVKDGFVRFFSDKASFTITISGNGVTPIDKRQHVYHIKNTERNLSH